MARADMECAHGAPIATSGTQAAGRVNGVNPCGCDSIGHDERRPAWPDQRESRTRDGAGALSRLRSRPRFGMDLPAGRDCTTLDDRTPRPGAIAYAFVRGFELCLAIRDVRIRGFA